MGDQENDPSLPQIPSEMLKALEAHNRILEQMWSDWRPAMEAASRMIEVHAKTFQATVKTLGLALAQAQEATRTLRTIGPLLEAAWRGALPSNWPVEGTGARLVRQAVSVVADEAIPLAWVPRSGIVTELIGAQDGNERIKILLAHKDDIVADCEACLDHCTALDLADSVKLARCVIDAYKDDHQAAAQSLAVSVTERLITDHVVGAPARDSYKKAKELATFRGEIRLSQVRRAIAIAPIVRFYAEWYPWSGKPEPAELSRHVSVHHASPRQYSPENSLLAVMLLVSLLREFSEWMVAGRGLRHLST
jgi:hypothetical protein